MSPAERLAVLRRGVAALRAVEIARRRALPPPERPDPVQLRALRDVASLADALEMAIEIDGLEQGAVWARDATLSMQLAYVEVEELRALAAGRDVESPYQEDALGSADRDALAALADLLARYEAQEFMPPNSYFGIPEPAA